MKSAILSPQTDEKKNETTGGININNVDSTANHVISSPIIPDKDNNTMQKNDKNSLLDPTLDKLREEIRKLTIERDNAVSEKNKTELECRDLYQKWNHRLSQVCFFFFIRV